MEQNTNTAPTITQGYWFFFDIDGKKVAAHGSSWSGRELVFIDDELVSDKRNYRFNSEHKFKIGERDCRLQFKVTNWLTGELVCSLFEEDALLATASKAFYENKSSFLGMLAKMTLLGFVAGFAAVYLIKTLS